MPGLIKTSHSTTRHLCTAIKSLHRPDIPLEWSEDPRSLKASQADWVLTYRQRPSVLDHTYVGGGRILHADDVVTGVDMENFAGDAARHGRQEVDGALADLLDGHRATQRRVVFVPPQYVPKVADAGGGERFDRAGRDRVDANALFAQVGREIANAGLERSLGDAHDIIVRHPLFRAII